MGPAAKEVTEVFRMQLLLPQLPETEGPQTSFLPDHRPRNSVSSVLGRILAGRYKILKRIDPGTFKGHDLALDQTVNVRQVLCASQQDRDIWCQKAIELIGVRNSNFLNVIDLICEESSDFVISEYPRGRLIAELVGERPPLVPDDLPLNAQAAPPPKILPLKAEKPEGLEIATDQDQQPGSISLKQDVPDINTSAEPTPFSAIVLGPEIGLAPAKPDQSNWSPTHRRAYAPAMPEKIERKRYRSPDRSRTLNVQMQLIALWHKSLHQSGRPRNSTLFSNWDDRRRIVIARSKP